MITHTHTHTPTHWRNKNLRREMARELLAAKATVGSELPRLTTFETLLFSSQSTNAMHLHRQSTVVSPALLTEKEGV